MRIYPYVGPAAIKEKVNMAAPRHEVTTADGLMKWALDAGYFSPGTPSEVFTYTVLSGHHLFIADRHSEHIACARGAPVECAGEIAFRRSKTGLVIEEASNLSTGYCPESSAWVALDLALKAAGFPGVQGFTTAFEFRYCQRCLQTCVIKDEVYECPSCLEPLPAEWNYATGALA
ncbi:hypothetical protein [Verrucomicrobium spinosum]|uniref:hypothetical protein n=1 Tax=Verrucomicrobium spinosum TaxID=2736 RepID=UPI0001745BE0|nr:hypothetical protein [Verrucomicrobium spinosum]